eukprot:jgi/Ulvmu1/1160/UM107_0034.1
MRESTAFCLRQILQRGNDHLLMCFAGYSEARLPLLCHFLACPGLQWCHGDMDDSSGADSQPILALSAATATTDTPCKFSWASEYYLLQSSSIWPGRGNHILAQFNEEAVVVYQAYKPEIARYAAEHQRFEGCPQFKTTRMTWIKPNFLWMMFRSRWASKPGQERVLAIWLRRCSFDRYLANARTSGSVRGFGGTVRLQWDPDHLPTWKGDRHPHCKAVLKAAQLGLTGVTTFMNGEDVLQIDDITDFVEQQRPLPADAITTAPDSWHRKLLVARERVYRPSAAAPLRDSAFPAPLRKPPPEPTCASHAACRTSAHTYACSPGAPFGLVTI